MGGRLRRARAGPLRARPPRRPGAASCDRARPGLGSSRGHDDRGSDGRRPRERRRERLGRRAPRFAAYAAGQAAVVAHVAAHDLGAAAYAIKAVRAAAPAEEAERAGRLECQWQRDRLPDAVRALVLDDERARNELCWFVFDC
ncbi:MAG TPA: hypothetical protein VGK63_01645 [Candidatus Limnocylindrales bacterium]